MRTVRIQNEYGREAHDTDVKKFFGLDPKDKWPSGGMPPVEVQGVTMWVGPIVPGLFRIRALCRCPQCGKVIPVGRLNQHWKVHT